MDRFIASMSDDSGDTIAEQKPDLFIMDDGFLRQGLGLDQADRARWLGASCSTLSYLNEVSSD